MIFKLAFFQILLILSMTFSIESTEASGWNIRYRKAQPKKTIKLSNLEVKYT